MQPYARLKEIGLFTDLDDGALAAICGDIADVQMQPGQVLFSEGELGDQAFAIVTGTCEVIKVAEGRDVTLATLGPGNLVGEMALLREAPRMATVRASTATTLLAIPKRTLDRLIESSPDAARAIFTSLIRRMHTNMEQLRHNERMAQLGTLTAGIAHELNNPASAVRRGADRLGRQLAGLADLLASTQLSAPARSAAFAWLHTRTGHPGIAREVNAVVRSDIEDALASTLERYGIDEVWDVAPALADAGVSVDELTEVLTQVADEDRQLVAQLTANWLDLAAVAFEVSDAASRLSDIVQALKGYSYLDQAPVQDVDVIQGIEDTLVLLRHKTRHVGITRKYADDVPTITAFGSQLNQVWTNLIDNACDAVADTGADGQLVLRVEQVAGDIVVEIEDNGPGIPADVQPRIFDAFFTTKPPGKGTGLGLQTSHRIVTDHGGELTFETSPGRTVFRVILPADRQERA